MLIGDKLIGGLPLNLGKCGIIKQPTIKQIATIGEEKFNELLYPFIISVNMLSTEQEIDLVDFDLFFLIDKGEFIFKDVKGTPLLATLVEALVLFYDTEKVELIFDEQKIVVDETIEINRNNFDEVCKAILKITNRNKAEVQKPPKFKSETARKIYENTIKHRERYKNKHRTLMADYMNVVIHNPVRSFSYEETMQMTYWQLLNSYVNVNKISNYEDFLKYKVSFKFDIKENIEPWQKDIQLNKEEVQL